ncbi:MAG: low molecular weight phosphotyrosine protein phosphatase [Lentisphaeria bacterium]|nr:low molecular weight phosphotyrosine protein phosphatase [Lentisphaeria bacterium]
MIKILFVCHGNICRSPMAEFCMKKLVSDSGRAEVFEIASAATSTEEIGNSVYPPAKRLLQHKGIDCSGKSARQITVADYAYYDLIIGMDHANMRNMKRFWNGDPDNKLRMLMDYTDTPGEVADPWYSGDFETTWHDVFKGCSRLLESLV